MDKPKKTSLLIFIAAILFQITINAQNELIEPAFEQVLSLKYCGSPAISNDGNHVLFSMTSTDWKENRYDSEIWLSKSGQEPFQLTNTPKGNSYAAKWSPDDQWISFLSDRGNKSQIFVMRADGGEALPVSDEEIGIQNYEWAPDGSAFIYTRSEGDSKKDKNRKERYGEYEEDEAEFKRSWLYMIPFEPNNFSKTELPCYSKSDSTYQNWPCETKPNPVALVDSVDFTIRNFSISPDFKYIVFTHSPDPFIPSFMDADISLLDLSDTTFTKVVDNKSSDSSIGWSPDGENFIYSTHLDNRDSNFYSNSKLFYFNLKTRQSTPVASAFDENLNVINWTSTGIFATASQRTEIHLFKIDPYKNQIQKITNLPSQINGASITNDGKLMALSGNGGTDLNEVYTTPLEIINLKKITHLNHQIQNWKVAQSEVISWKSVDGTEIEGVLHKPIDFDPNKKYPLLVMIHGGPTGVDRPSPILYYVYPVNQWLNKGSVVLRVNYRGSAGYGEAFRSLNVENLGVGDAWDVLSGVDFLIDKGFVDESRMGCMGWSQGGYISAFLATTSDKFKAISVGAGISNWMTYYVNTDIHPFTRQYLKATPWDNEEVYRKTSPMTYIKNASTPTLIQHGEFDMRVPIPNAYELHQGLKDNGVPSKLMVYKGFGHGITKPKERLAAVWHNWQWFGKYIWEEEIELPVNE